MVFHDTMKCIRLCQTVSLTDPSNDQLVKDKRAQIFYSIRSQTKPTGIGANCENPSQPLPHNVAPTTRTYDRALIPLVGPCVLPIHPTTNWWKMRWHKSFIAFDRRSIPLVLVRIMKIRHKLINGYWYNWFPRNIQSWCSNHSNNLTPFWSWFMIYELWY